MDQTAIGGCVLRARVRSRKTRGGLRNPPRGSPGNEGRDVLSPERYLEGCQHDSPPGFAGSQLSDMVLGHSNPTAKATTGRWVTDQPGVDEEAVAWQVWVLPRSDVSSAWVMQQSQQWSF